MYRPHTHPRYVRIHNSHRQFRQPSMENCGSHQPTDEHEKVHSLRVQKVSVSDNSLLHNGLHLLFNLYLLVHDFQAEYKRKQQFENDSSYTVSVRHPVNHSWPFNRPPQRLQRPHLGNQQT
jgi:hypothetical protein